MIRWSVAALLLLFGHHAALACSCGPGNPVSTAREIATGAAIVAEFELIEPMDFANRRGPLIRPIRTYVGVTQPAYRVKFTEDDPCTSSFDRGWVGILYRDESTLFDENGVPRGPDLAHELGEAANSRKRLAQVRAAVKARNLDAPAAEYDDPGLCLQLFLTDRGAVDLVRREARRAGRRVPARH